MKFKKITNKEDKVWSSDLHYDLFDGGYIEPGRMLENHGDVVEVNAAIDLIRDFLSEAQENGNLGVM